MKGFAVAQLTVIGQQSGGTCSLPTPPPVVPRTCRGKAKHATRIPLSKSLSQRTRTRGKSAPKHGPAACSTSEVHLSRPVQSQTGPFPSLATCTYRPTRETGISGELHKHANSIAKGRDRSFRRPTTHPASVERPPPSQNLQTSRHGASRFHRPRRPVLPPSSLPPPARIPFHPILILHTLSPGQVATAPTDSRTVTTPSRAHSTFFSRGTIIDHRLHTPSAGDPRSSNETPQSSRKPHPSNLDSHGATRGCRGQWGRGASRPRAARADSAAAARGGRRGEAETRGRGGGRAR